MSSSEDPHDPDDGDPVVGLAVVVGVVVAAGLIFWSFCSWLAGR